MIDVKAPVVVGVPLDETTEDVVRVAATLAQKLGTSLVPVHVLPPWPFPTARRTDAEAERARAALRTHLAPWAESGLSIVEPVLAESDATSEILDVARRTRAQMVVVGQGTGPTVGRWLLGSVADRVVRSARCPVFVARGTLPGKDLPVVCAVDLSPHSRLGFVAALRMARLFGAPLRVVTVVPAIPLANVAELEADAEGLSRASRAELDSLVAEHDTTGVAVEVVLRAGNASSVLVEECDRGGLAVIASRAFDMLVPASLGNVTSRLVRGTRSSVLAVRDLDDAPAARERRLGEVSVLRKDAAQAMVRGDYAAAEADLRLAAALLPGLASIDDELAEVLDKAGRRDEAERWRAVARLLRDART